MASDENIGRRMKERRHQVRMSLRELAHRTKLTASFLSQVERGQTSMSISSLRRIADALEVPILYFLSEDLQPMPVVKADKRSKITLPGTDVTYELLTPDLSRKMEIMLGRLEPGSGRMVRPARSPTEEFILVLSGMLRVELHTGEYLLSPGDSIYYDGTTLRALSCASKQDDEDAVWLTAITPPVL